MQLTQCPSITTQGPPSVISDHEATNRGTAPHVSTEDLQCPICVEPLRDAFVTACGHTFCYQCILTHLKHKRNCPNCSSYLTTDRIYPNFLLNKIVSKAAAAAAESPWLSSLGASVQQALSTAGSHLTARELDAAIATLRDARSQLVQQEASSGLHLLLLLLQDAKRQRQAKVEELRSQLDVLQRDMEAWEQQQRQQQQQTAEQQDQVMITSLPHSAAELEQRLQTAAATAAAAGGHLHVHTLTGNSLATLSIPVSQLSALDTGQLAQALHAASQAQAAARTHAVAALQLPALPPATTAADTAEPPAAPAGPGLSSGSSPLPPPTQRAAQQGTTGAAAPLKPLPALQAISRGQFEEAAGAGQPESGTPTSKCQPVTLKDTEARSSDDEMDRRENASRRRVTAVRRNGHDRPPRAPSAPQQPALVLAGPHPPGSGQGSVSAAAVGACSAIKSVLGVRPHSWSGATDEATLRAAKKRLILTQFENLQNAYLTLRASDTFQQVLSGATTFSRLVRVAEVPRAALGGPLSNTARSTPAPRAGQRASSTNFVSCIDFDASERLFATCSPQRVCLWDYSAVVSSPPDQQAAKGQISTRTKLTNLAFGRAQPHLLACSDSEGKVCLYDVSTLQSVLEVEAHDSRVWALEFCPLGGDGGMAEQAYCLASGSDDYTVRVWDARDGKACSTIDTRANVCSVRYNPWDSHYLAVGSAGHAVHVYDLRKAGGATPPLVSLMGHSKAVSYVRWASRSEVVSASTDSSLRLWNVAAAVCPGSAGSSGAAIGAAGGAAAHSTGVHACSCVRTYTGHVNERNFVGLSVNQDLIAAGSETNEVVVYYKPLCSPAIRHALSPLPPPTATGRVSNPGSQLFISSLTWRAADMNLVVSSSQGSVHVLSLQQ